MKRLTALTMTLAFTLSAWAWTYESQESTTEQVVQFRAGVDFSKKWNNGLKFSASEEVRVDAYNSLYGANFSKAYTTLTLGYSPIEYIKMDVGYTLRVMGRKNWNDPNEVLRHRVFFSAGAVYPTRYVKLSLRERFLCEMRTDSVNLLEKNKYNWLLRSRIGADFIVPGKPVKPYIWCELENTLNVPEYQQKEGRQYISRVRTQAGVKWRLNAVHSLDFYYRFQYKYNRDINITKNKGYIELTEATTYLHAIGVVYCLDW